MFRLLADENSDGRVIRGLLLRLPDLDLARAQDVGLANTDDRVILDWAAAEGRILLTRDRETMPGFMADRMEAGLSSPGVFLVEFRMPVGRAIEQLEEVIECSEPEEWADLVTFFSA